MWLQLLKNIERLDSIIQKKVKNERKRKKRLKRKNKYYMPGHDTSRRKVTINKLYSHCEKQFKLEPWIKTFSQRSSILFQLTKCSFFILIWIFIFQNILYTMFVFRNLYTVVPLRALRISFFSDMKIERCATVYLACLKKVHLFGAINLAHNPHSLTDSLTRNSSQTRFSNHEKFHTWSL